jgi:uncharacterized membrane protein
MVTPARLVHGIDVHAVEDAVRAAERGTTGEIRVCIARFPFWGDVQRAAARAFSFLGMERTRHRNGVLLFVAPRQRRFVVLGDAGIHALVEPTFWSELAERLTVAFKAGDRTGGLVRAIAEIGERLSRHFPGEPGPDVNELPDEVARGSY